MKRWIFILILSIVIPLWGMAQELTIYTTSSARLHNAGEVAGFKSMSSGVYAIGTTAPTFNWSGGIASSHTVTGKTSLPQSHIYAPFSGEAPSVRKAPGDHSGGTEVQPPDLDPIGEGTAILLLLSMLYFIITLVRCRKLFV